ncbi:TraR/DksA family transcriptional regulator [Corallococcus carmarthensis]|uniref:Zinc finger DksA/TraR C4-type domain-containing protein n=1 Tax=Corallococcus carmarthensis TaxID=2316728 RepID=A0A3A8KBM1_9BACT|nr:TraR/DksA C4-type zinc finger protein [Corallococcus carmarthensis]NOK18404.1 hypothetical protein [Corallococcus carmarthensis]RKG99791.1 hypothetical protein D7X32_25405 [Corallococcus carmarthensis]
MDAMREAVGEQLRQRWRTLLEARRQHRRLLREVTGTGAPEWVDRAVALEETRLLDELDAREARALEAVEVALAHLPPEGLPRCEGCGADIEPERLQALPEARCCLRCAARTR